MRIDKKTREDMELIPYMRKAQSFMSFEKDNIESIEMLISIRKISVHADIALYMRYFKNEEYMNNAKCLIGLYNIFEEWKEEKRISEADVFESTLVRFKRYGEYLRREGVE